MPHRTLKIEIESWPIAGSFAISRGTKTMAEVVAVEIVDQHGTGHGECVPYRHYGETPGSVQHQLETIRNEVETGQDRDALQRLLPPGAARNAIDCALIDLEAKSARQRAWHLLGLPEPQPMPTAYTLSLNTPAAMAAAAAKHADLPVLKIKLGGDGDIERLQAIRAAAPAPKLIIDANEAWTPANLFEMAEACATANVAMIEQPLPADQDAVLSTFDSPVPLCADESAHDRNSLRDIVGRYQYINIKLDKTGGLTEAIELAKAARENGLKVMVGCMVGTSLSMAPASLLGPFAEFIDLDAPLLLAKDRSPGLKFDGVILQPPEPALWG